MKAACGLLAYIAAAALFFGASATLAQAQVFGAIFTTDSTCQGVNINIYGDPSKTDPAEIENAKKLVYLDGGPAHPQSAGLPPGDYYVQITEPDGTVLGKSPDAFVHVLALPNPPGGGEFESCYQLWEHLKTASSSFVDTGYDTTTNNGGEYKVWISKNPAFPPSESKTDNFKIIGGADGGGNPREDTATLCVDKFYDANANGLYDTGEVLINDWLISVSGASLQTIRPTDFCIVVDPGSYSVMELFPVEQDWIHTASLLDGVPQALSSPVSVTLAKDQTKTVLFGNVCLGAGGGHTLGFWSNKNGQATMNDGGTLAPELALLSSKNLRDASGNNFDPGSYTAFRTWLLNATAVNMAYMLSAQMAAMVLNVEAGFVSGSALVYAPQLLPYSTPGLNALGFISINDLLTAANTELGLHGYTPAGNSFRAYQEALKNALDSANNNQNFVQPTPCPFTFAL